MANITQHEAAELWEVARDHHLASAKMLWMAQSVQDPQLRQMLQQHGQRCQQAAQQLDGFLHQGGTAYGGGQSFPAGGQNWQSGSAGANGGQSWQAQGQGGFTSGLSGHSPHPIDVLAAGECLKECKSMAVKCMWGATEASQPARGFLQQLAGEHLHMAEQHYRWLEQRGLYASPKADQQALQTYDQKVHQIAQSGQQAVQIAQAVLAGAQPGQFQQGSYQQHQPYQQYQPYQSGQQYGQQYSQQYGQGYSQPYQFSQQAGQSYQGSQYGQQYSQPHTHQ